MAVWLIRAPYNGAKNLLYIVLRERIDAIVEMIEPDITHELPKPSAGPTLSFEGQPPRQGYKHLKYRAAHVEPLWIDVVDVLVVDELVSELFTVLDSVVIIRYKPDKLCGVELPEEGPIGP